MTEPVSIITLSIAGLAGLAMLTAASLSGWRGWLELQRLSLGERRPGHDMTEPGDLPSPTGARIELADLRERVRKLEAIAAGIDL